MDAYQTNPLRVIAAVVVGTAVGAALVMLWMMSDATDIDVLRQFGIQDAATVFLYAACAWAAGLIILASGPWAILHHCGLRGPSVAVVLGAVLSFAVMLELITTGFGNLASGHLSAADAGGPTWIDGTLTSHGWMVALQASLMCGVAGAVIALAVWRTAYVRPRNVRKNSKPLVHRAGGAPA